MAVNLHPNQAKVFRDIFIDKIGRHFVICASRGWGKSFFVAACAIKALWELFELPFDVPNKNVYIIAPTYSQVTKIYYPILAFIYGLEKIAIRYSKAEGIFEFRGGVTLQLVSYEAVERLRGTGAYFVACDEVSSWTKGDGHQSAWEAIIEPCIATRWSPEQAAMFGAESAGRSVTISTPKGFNYFYDLFNFREIDEDWHSYHFDYTTSPFLSATEIEKIKHRIDPLEFAREYLARFEGSGNNIFYCFDRKIHVQKDLPYFFADPKIGYEDVHVCIDFNVGLQCTSAWAIRGNRYHCLDEFKGHPDTWQLAEVLKKKYANHRILAYPDPSGRARKTSAPTGVTDFAILEKAGIHILAKRAAPPITDSVKAVNAKLRNAAGEIAISISPDCKGVIESFERTVWVDNNPDLAVIDKKQGVEHYSDGCRYFFDYVAPITGKSTAARGFGF